MQIRKTAACLTRLLPDPATLLKLARKSRFVLRTCRKIFPDALLRSVLLAVCENTPHFRAVAEKISSISDHDPSRQGVFGRLKNEAAPNFFFSAFRQVLVEQCRRFTDRHLTAALECCTGIFLRIIIEDGSVLPLHRSLADRFRGSVNQHGETAALRLRWAFDYLTGETIDAQLHHWRENDMSTAFELLAYLKKDDLVLRDMRYFCLRSFHEIIGIGAFFITRLPEGTVVTDGDGKRMNIPATLRKCARNVHEWQVKVGRDNSVERRLIAARIDRAKAAERKRRLRQSCKEAGKVATRDQLAMCEWVVVFTNVEASAMDAESVAQLYRARWMVEIFFKGMKSGQQLEKWSRHRTNENTIECLAYAQMIIAILSLNMWRVTGRMLAGRAQETPGAEARADGSCGSMAVRTVGPIKALESIIPLLVKVFAGELEGRALGEELSRLAHYAAQEKRTRPSLDGFVIGLLT